MYKVIAVEAGSWGSVDENAVTQYLNTWAELGWRLVSMCSETTREGNPRVLLCLQRD